MTGEDFALAIGSGLPDNLRQRGEHQWLYRLGLDALSLRVGWRNSDPFEMHVGVVVPGRPDAPGEPPNVIKWFETELIGAAVKLALDTGLPVEIDEASCPDPAAALQRLIARFA
ncbi:hypothetical protein [Deinococcus kurensis]|uniref:hypothetical protein n=1 Tax=Deinococcus kurensis TaxID=2662757 RepID=UPI0012D2EAB8|nr:hypothetical protein [Deinococcus kurensis]